MSGETRQYAPDPGGSQRLAAEDNNLSRIVPSSIEAEACVLGAMAIDTPSIDIVVQILRPEYFHRPAHETIFKTLLEMRDVNKPIDLVSLRAELSRRHSRDAEDQVVGLDRRAALEGL